MDRMRFMIASVSLLAAGIVVFWTVAVPFALDVIETIFGLRRKGH
jgi:hypothetical protein